MPAYILYMYYKEFKKIFTKKYILAYLGVPAYVFFILLSLTSCNNSDTNKVAGNSKIVNDSANFTSVKWEDSLVNFGTVNQGDKIHILFHCKNTGTKPLYIVSVQPSCGCTVASYTKEAIAPGMQGNVDAIFDSGHSNTPDVRKVISVTTNTIQASPTLVFTGTVILKDKEDKKDL